MTYKTTKKELLEKIISSIYSECISTRGQTITEKTRFRYDLDLTSLDIVDVIIKLESFYNVTLEFSTASIDTVGQLCDTVYNIITQEQQNAATKQVSTKTVTSPTEQEIFPIFVKIQDIILRYNEDNEPHRVQKITKPIPRDKQLVGKTGLGFDELDKLQLIMEIEQEFGIEISQPTIDSFKTVKDIVLYVLLASKNKQPNIQSKIINNQKQK